MNHISITKLVLFIIACEIWSKHQSLSNIKKKYCITKKVKVL